MHQNEYAGRVPPALLGIPDVQAATGLGRSKIYELMTSGHLKSIKIGRRRLVPAESLSSWVRSVCSGAGFGDTA